MLGKAWQGSMKWPVTLQETMREIRALNYLAVSLFLQSWAPSLRDDDAHSWSGYFFFNYFSLRIYP